MRPTLRTLSAASAALVLAGCGNVPVISQVSGDYPQIYAYEQINYAASRGPVPVFVRGSPFTNDPGNASFAAAMQRHTSVPNVRFVPSPVPGDSGYRIVLAFGTIVPGVNYCSGNPDFPLSSRAAAGDQIVANFCVQGGYFRQLVASGGPMRSPADPAFDTLMAALTNDLTR